MHLISSIRSDINTIIWHQKQLDGVQQAEMFVFGRASSYMPIIWNRAGSLTLWYACNCIKFIHWKWFEILQKLKSLFLKLYMLNLIIVFKERMCCFSLILFHIPTLIPTNVNHSWMCIRKSSFLLSLKTPVQIVSLCPTDKILVWFPTSQK